MTTSFVDIYAMVMQRIDDPSLTKLYETSPIAFYTVMYNYLESAIPSFSNPIEEMQRLRNQTLPFGESDTFIGDGEENVFSFTNEIADDSILEASVNGVLAEYTYNSIDNTITFETVPQESQKVVISWYFPGKFNFDMYSEEKDILSLLTSLNWAEKEKNFKLDIRTLIGDKTYRADSSARTSVGNKVSWYEAIQEDCQKKMNRFAWNYYMVKKRYGGEPAWLHLKD